MTRSFTCSILLVFIVFFLSDKIHGQYSLNTSIANVKSIALGNSGIAYQDNLSHHFNPAHLAWIESHNVEAFASNYFLVKNLFQFAGHFHAKMSSKDGLGLSYVTVGSPTLRENLLQLSYGRKLSKIASLGITGNYNFSQGVENYSESNIDFNTGLFLALKPYLNIALIAKNPFPLRHKENYNLPSLFAIGLQYKIYEHVSVLVDLQKKSATSTSGHIGLIYRIQNAVSLQTGFNTSNKTISGGASFILYKNLELNFAVQYHSTLGTSPAFSVRYQIPKK